MENEITKLNYVCEKTAVRANYDLSERETSIKVYFTASGKLIIKGVIDNNYIYWLSITKPEETEINKAIFDFISKGKYEIVSNVANALKYAGYDYNMLTRACAAQFKRRENGWTTPFRHFYGDDEKCNGKFFAQDIVNLYDKLKKQCEYTEADGKYEEILKNHLNYIKTLRYENYSKDVEPIAEILEKQGYLAISQNYKIRDLYFECLDLCNQKYNDYMDAAHGLR